MSRLQSQRDKPHRRQSGNSCQDEFTSGDQWNWRGTGTQTDVSGCQHARLGLKPADHNEEYRARIVRHMSADDNLKQRVQIAQDPIVETTPPEARTGERDLVPEPARKKVRFADELKNKHPRVPLLQIHGVSAAVRAVQAAVPTRIPQAVKPRLHHRFRLTKAIRTARKDRKLLMVLMWSWKGWS